MDFRRIPKKVVFVDRDEMQKRLDFCRSYTMPIFRKKGDDETFKMYSFIEDLRSTLKLAYKIGGVACTYVFKLDTGLVQQKVSGVDSFKIMSRYYKVPRFKDCDERGSARPFLFINKKYDSTRNFAYGYDINSAYSWAMMQEIPDTTKVVGINRYVGPDEIGFSKLFVDNDLPEIISKQDDLLMIGEGNIADIIFKKMPSPFTRFVETWYNRKKIAKTKDEKLYAKQVLNLCIGYMQNVNPYIRATILTRVNNRVASLIDKDTLFCNTDSLVSKTRRLDIEANVGDEIGQWKVEHEGYFAYKGYNYQWDDNVPTYRGEPKAWFKHGYDILTDEPPKPRNKYRLNHETLVIEEIEYEEE